MLIYICGHEYGNTMGNLKTAFMTYNLYLDYIENKRPIYANYGLKFPYKPLTSLKNLLDLVKDESNVSIAIDELSVYIDNYTSISAKNKKDNDAWNFKTFGRQTRKRKVKVYSTAQTFSDIHKSLRKIATKILLTRKMHNRNNECYDEFCYKKHIIEVIDAKMGTISYFNIPQEIFKLYDSDEIIDLED